jgi:hypothetical protein
MLAAAIAGMSMRTIEPLALQVLDSYRAPLVVEDYSRDQGVKLRKRPSSLRPSR